MVSASDSQSRGPGFESRSGHLLAGFVLGRPELKSSATLVNSQLGASCQLGFILYLKAIFSNFSMISQKTFCIFSVCFNKFQETIFVESAVQIIIKTLGEY